MDTGRSYIQTWEKRTHDDKGWNGLCQFQGAEPFHQLLKSESVDKIKEETDAILAVPRPPAMSPCF
jgi:hypothetical protein